MSSYYRAILIWIPLLFSMTLWGQSRDIRSQSVYHDGDLQLKSKAEFYYDFWSEQDVLHGRYSEWDRSGNLVLDCEYKDGRLEGTYTRYYPEDGRTREVSHWRDGQLSGKQEVFNRSGGILISCNYQNGLLQGVCTKYDKHSHIRSSIHYLNGQKEGPASYFNRKGELLRTRHYRGGNVVRDQGGKNTKEKSIKKEQEKKAGKPVPKKTKPVKDAQSGQNPKNSKSSPSQPQNQ